MPETIQIDKAGRLVLPKRLRERLSLKGGDTLNVEVKNDVIELRPSKPSVRLVRVNGVLVLTGAAQLPEGRDFVAEQREERVAELISRTKV